MGSNNCQGGFSGGGLTESEVLTLMARDQTGSVQGLRLVWDDEFTVQIQSGVCYDKDDTFFIRHQGMGAIDLVSTISGAGGVDVGVATMNTMYFVHIIADSTGVLDPSGIISLSKTAPTIPAGYDKFRRLGQVVTEANDATKFVHFAMGAGAQQTFSGVRTYLYRTILTDTQVLLNGTAGGFTSVSLIPFVPPAQVNEVYLHSKFEPIADLDTFEIISDATTPFAPSKFRPGIITPETNDTMNLVSTGNGTILYKTDNLSPLSLSVTGYIDYI